MKKILAVIILIISLFYFFRIYKIDGTSMNYGLLEDDIVITSTQFDTIHRGDLLVMRHPQDPEDRLYIKRCAALPGDKFFEKERVFYLQIAGDSNKTKNLAHTYDLKLSLTKEGYFLKAPYRNYYNIVHNWHLDVPTELSEIALTTIEKGHYLMLGDYRDNSADSRFFGAVPRAWIYSKVILIVKKPTKWLDLIAIEEVDH